MSPNGGGDAKTDLKGTPFRALCRSGRVGDASGRNERQCGSGGDKDLLPGVQLGGGQPAGPRGPHEAARRVHRAHLVPVHPVPIQDRQALRPHQPPEDARQREALQVPHVRGRVHRAGGLPCPPAPPRRPHRCPVCKKAFAQLEALQRVHAGEKPYRCGDCSIDCAHVDHFGSHQIIHTGERPYRCTACGKNFTRSDYLRSHRRTHTGEKPFRCATCGKAFAHPATLSTHTRIHTGENLYRCDVCGKAFTHPGGFHIHKRTHMGERPYACTTSGKAFAESGTLHVHARQMRSQRCLRRRGCDAGTVPPPPCERGTTLAGSEEPRRAEGVNRPREIEVIPKVESPAATPSALEEEEEKEKEEGE
uniref:Zinc finger protein 235-like n=1 Tax=Petromyzon marinus TaxID=7757 RepID=A0AAJ7UJ67_PETMA|nr:zinc finger protein 235-like [Petromyzon marinus]